MRGGTAYRPYVVLWVCRVRPLEGLRIEQTEHHVLQRAIDQARRGRDAWQALTGEYVPSWRWIVIDRRGGQTVYDTAQEEE